MSSYHDIDSPDSLQMLLRKASAIHTVNTENIANIEARKGHKVVVKHQYTLQAQSHANKQLKTTHDSDDGNHDDNHNNNNMFELVDKTSTKNVDDIIAAWTYRGESLIKEKIAIDDFIDRKLVGYDDLVRLNNKYGMLLNKYSLLLTDETDSRVAAQCVKHNMELLQVAIGDVHERVLDAADNDRVRKAMSVFAKHMSKGWKTLESEVEGVKLNIDMKSNTAESNTEADVNVVCLNNVQALSCKHVLSGHASRVRALQSYTLNDKQYLASASHDRKIKLWDMTNNTLAATLTGHTNAVIALALYVHNGIQMLASGSCDNTIKLWNVSNNTCVHTLRGHTDSVVALAVYENDDDTILISSSRDNTIKLWNLHTHNIITTLQGHSSSVYCLAVYNHDGNAYLASGSWDRTIKIWRLDDHALVRTIDEDDGGWMSSLLVVNSNDRQILASGDSSGNIKLWSVGDYECIGNINAQSDGIHSLAVIECDGKVCLVSASSDKTIKIWDLESQTVMTTLHNDFGINGMEVFMNGDEACLAIGDNEGNVKLWME